MTTYLLDCGHGGTTAEGKSSATGLTGPSGLREKDVTLELGKRIARRLGGGASLTRTDDRNLSLRRRVEMARERGVEAFVSLHAGDHGSSVWVHPRSTASSRELGKLISRAFARLGGAGERVEAGDLAVLDPDRHHPRTAACLVEVGDLCSAEGERLLRDPAFLDRMADAISAGVRDTRYGLRARALEAPRSIADYARPLRELVDAARSDPAVREEVIADPISALAKRGVEVDSDVAPGYAAFLRNLVASEEGAASFPVFASLTPEELAAPLEGAFDEPRSAAAGLAEDYVSARRTAYGVVVTLSHQAALDVASRMMSIGRLTAAVAAAIGLASPGPQAAGTIPTAAIVGLVAAIIMAIADVLKYIDSGNGITVTVPWISLVPGFPPIAIPAPR